MRSDREMAMRELSRFYINGQWVDPVAPVAPLDIVSPATETVIGHLAMGRPEDVDRAVAAARAAFDDYASSSKEARVALLERVIEGYKARLEDMAQAISVEMGAPIAFARAYQAPAGLLHLETITQCLREFPFEARLNLSTVVREPVGVCGLITPWNWPVNQIVCKVVPALAAGCSMVLKPSEMSPLSSQLFSEIIHDAGIPAGVYNMVTGEGPVVGERLCTHPDVDMISFTGSTRAGKQVARLAAETVKRVTQELGGKSANILLDDADLGAAVPLGVMLCFMNTGQTCTAPTRMLVPRALQQTVVDIAVAVAATVVVGDPRVEGTMVGPLANAAQFAKVQRLIAAGVEEGATLACGGVGRPAGVDRGYYVKPTIFSNVVPDMLIAREEIFGPVLSIIPYDSEDEAIRIANGSSYGLAGYVQSVDPARARRVAGKIRAGTIMINGAAPDPCAPMGGYKQSGNGREWGRYSIEEYLEVKSLMGWH